MSKILATFSQLSPTILPNVTKTVFQITVPKKVGKAVYRNKLKRRVKNIISNNENYIQSNYNYVIIIKEPSLELDYEGLEKKLLELMKKVGTK